MRHLPAALRAAGPCARARVRPSSSSDLPLLVLLLAGLATSARRDAFSKYTFPAMSPTMTEGGIAAWKKQVGDSFTAGDVVFEIVRPLPLRGVCLAVPHSTASPKDSC